MKKLIFTLLIFITFVGANAQQTFEKIYSFYNGNARINTVFIQDDGYLLAGTNNTGQHNIFLIKADLNGDTVWTKTLNTPVTGFSDMFTAVDYQNNIYLTTTQGSNDLIKVSPQGEIIWAKEIYPNADIYCMEVSPDNNLLIAHNQNNSTYLAKFDRDGNEMWRTVAIVNPGSGGQKPTALNALGNGNILMAVSNNTTTPENSTLYYYPPTGTDGINTALQASEPMVLKDIFITGKKIISLGIPAGLTGDNNRSFYLNHNPTGVVSIQRNRTLPFQNTNLIKFIASADNNLITLATVKENATSAERIMLHATNQDGDSLWTKVLGGPGITNAYDIVLATDGGYLISASIDVSGTARPYIIKTDALGNYSHLGIETNPEKLPLTVYPNPATTSVVFETTENVKGNISISDLQGRLCLETPITGIRTEVSTGSLRPGIYVYTISGGNSIRTGKISVK